ncbi:DUF6114 domain-containing protein [Actinoplanes sp. NPDC049265]|uniref:DUF6114 domain-containing protein n=1 Tax=Actinoplanes sp. NPDC049265 TaxID=3363902 RepID=UPI00371AA1D7
MKASELWRRFGGWRRVRPFWGGLLMVLSAAVLFLSANLTLEAMQVHFGQEGFLSYLLPLMLLLCGLLVWFTPAQRLFYAVIGLLTSVYSLIGLNLGGFGVGMLLGIAGGALVIAWTPAPASAAPSPEATSSPRDATSSAPDAAPRDAAPRDAASPDAAATTDLRPAAQEPPPFADPGRKALAILAVPLAVGLSLVLAAHAPRPAQAEPACPKGMPSRTTTPSPDKSDRPEKVQRPALTKKPDPSAKKTPEPARSTDSKKGDDTGNPIVDGWNDFVDGVGELFGGGDDESPSPSPSASAPADQPTKPGPPTKPGESTKPTKPGVDPAEPGTPKPKNDDIPCLGPRVLDKTADPGDLPPAAIVGGLMEGDKLTMYDSTYDGVTTLDTATGKKRVLKFSMRKSETTPFKLTIQEPGGHTTVIDAGTLTTTGNVKFYTPKFEGKLFGIIPVTFTPDQPPPLTLPKLVFTDVKIDLSFVRSDVLTGKPLKITETR